MEPINEVIEHAARIAAAAVESYMDPGSPGVKDVVVEVARKLSKQIVVREWVSTVLSYRAGDYVNAKVESSVSSAGYEAFALVVKYRSVGVKVELSAEQALALLGSGLGTGWGLYAAMGPITSTLYRKSLEDITTVPIQEGSVKVTYVEPDRPYPGVYFVFHDTRATARSFEARLEELAARLGEAADTLGARPSSIGDPREALMVPHWCINRYAALRLEGLAVETGERIQGLATSACWDHFERKRMAFKVYSDARLVGEVKIGEGSVAFKSSRGAPLLLSRREIDAYRMSAAAEIARDMGLDIYNEGDTLMAASPYLALAFVRNNNDQRVSVRLPIPASVAAQGVELRAGLLLARRPLSEAEKGYRRSLEALEALLVVLASPELL